MQPFMITSLIKALISISDSAADIRNGSCVKATLYQPDKVHQVNGSYTVQLKANHTIEEHFAVIGLNLSETGCILFDLIRPGFYVVKTSDTIRDDFIRCDPDVEYVLQMNFGNAVGPADKIEWFTLEGDE